MSTQDTAPLEQFLPATERNVSQSFASAMLPDFLKAELAEKINNALQANGIPTASSPSTSAAQSGLSRAFSQAGGLPDTTKRALAQQVNRAVARTYDDRCRIS